MSTTSFEVVRTDAVPQPWHARLRVNGRITWRTENYTRMVGAARAILSAADAFGYCYPQLSLNVPGKPGRLPVEKILADADPAQPWISVRYLDERGARR